MRRTLAAGGRVNVDGYEITREMGDQLDSLSLTGTPASSTSRCLIVQVERNGKAVPARELEALRDRFASADLLVVQEEPFWKEILRFYDDRSQSLHEHSAMAGTSIADRQHAVTFENANGEKLFGIIHEPLAQARRDVGIILLSPGVKNRVAPHRLYNKMAAAYVSLGFWVFRFDCSWVGRFRG